LSEGARPRAASNEVVETQRGDVPEREAFHILLLRHGQTDANATGVLQGHQPTPLNSLGLLQAQRLAQRVARHATKVTALASSDLRRAVQTAEPVAAACGLTPAYDPAWRERGFGEFEGRHVGERDTWRAAHGDTDPPGAESLPDFRARVRRAFEALPQRLPGHKTIAVITHGGPIGILLRLLSDGSLPLAPGAQRPELIQAPNCSVMELIGERGGNAIGWRVACLSDVAHLDDLVTQADSG
jgi:2,3-bisphosphoglycerate-dependent phosphoglycerate mutase